VVSPKQYPAASSEDDFNRLANSIFLNILAANPWLQRFYPAAIRSTSGNDHKAKNLIERYPYFRGLNLMSLNPQVRICTHIKVTGHRCGSPALRGQRLCYFHQRMIHGVPTPPKARIHPMALIENEEAIQVALMETINAVVRNQIDLQRANLIIRALNIAVRNSRRVRFGRSESEMIRKLPEFPPAEIQPEALDQEAAPAPIEGPSPKSKRSAPAGTPPKLPARSAPAAIVQARPANAHPMRE
jgi:hypothetical protein